jgi:UDP-GlcNAc:undecaprenyl-phosphate/decaprenyl-phosphate GlcNAc-1-phosphate transferase
MRLKSKTVVILLFIISPLIAQEPQALSTRKEKISYGMGVDAARNFKRLGLDFDLDVLIKALRDVYSGGKLLMDEDELRTVMNDYQGELAQKQAQVNKAIAEQNKKAGDAFLAENKTKPGVVTLPSGLQYKVLKQGEGKKPVDSDTVEVHYSGSLIDGTEFDSSLKRGQPAAFPLAAIIPGWKEALKLMPIGSKWQLFIPAELAYGARGAGRDIKPNSTLIFEVELLAIK